MSNLSVDAFKYIYGWGADSLINAKQIGRMLDAAQDPIRLQMIFLLGRHGAMNVGQIAQHFEQISRPAVSHHLKVLKDAALVDSEKRGQEVFYSVNRADIAAQLRALADAIETCCLPE